ncbi:MAG: 6-phosphogluconate dehydrogenase (decarboxylating) [Candidatus Wildermuthbacteria bacterium RIFCSPLOWO2_02_FULL_47_9c]|uniref:6-phosphogluconate dehydrogenase, decarboxylating n=2 Tax=Parcubacteria group TaxID=1794811 RepID=A0A837IKR2_9BACT|nr:MAG: 6-phosphogluconate dehydrogenase, decarboxylating [Candidatus Yanofskybacteria bacterium GW2011_GWC1_48_11]KKW04522.1 MAG: 6-phosphogluconate dehydrogenase, decarboxylating [Parcubacteria group bacterium GW2011_GWB1_49_12]KKW09220.1 MAG: 6-phosphogluconate dehydrogenase, decarboxylating [Parcubacteria group bacterium GW2011_GWA1_49_26]KKW14142.1 MAG: 6-phosphogluconate dehydrogenase, decarboxylating [Parcubacteria group bacterium GW2011_GWA2_50_10]OHA61471.1 MAG: 6-phosphogluconate dehy
MKKQIGYIGLGKMGSAMVARLRRKGWRVVSYDANGTGAAKTIEQLMSALEAPRVIWIMVPAGKPVDDVIQELIPYFSKGDIVVDGGNSFFEDSFRRAEKLRRIGVSFVDVGVSGGPETVRKGKPALMIGGEKSMFGKLKPLFADITRRVSFEYMGASGAGHFVKMVHNGIEYGMMQALAEGFTLLKHSPFAVNLKEVARVYNNGSVIESRLVDWLERGLKRYGQDLEGASGSVAHTGEGEWTVKTAKKFGMSLPVIEASFDFRVRSAKKPSYTGKILSLLRHMFGGHNIK